MTTIGSVNNGHHRSSVRKIQNGCLKIVPKVAILAKVRLLNLFSMQLL